MSRNIYITDDCLMDIAFEHMDDDALIGLQNALEKIPTSDVVPYFIEDGVLTLDLSEIREKIHGCEIKIYFGSDWGGGTDEKIH